MTTICVDCGLEVDAEGKLEVSAGGYSQTLITLIELENGNETGAYSPVGSSGMFDTGFPADAQFATKNFRITVENPDPCQAQIIQVRGSFGFVFDGGLPTGFWENAVSPGFPPGVTRFATTSFANLAGNGAGGVITPVGPVFIQTALAPGASSIYLYRLDVRADPDQCRKWTRVGFSFESVSIPLHR